MWMINNGQLHLWVIHVGARLGIPVVTSCKLECLCKCLVRHGGTSLKRLGAVEIVPE